MSKFFKIGDRVKWKEWDSYLPIVDIRFHEIRLQEGGDFAWYNTALHNFEKEEPMKIEMDKKYRRVGTHEPVRVICTDRKDTVIPCIGYYNTGTSEGVIYFNYEGVSAAGNKIIEEIPQTDWSKVQVDSPIWVCGWPVHFARFDTEKQVIQYYHEGKTSHSNELKILGWNLPENCSLEKQNA